MVTGDVFNYPVHWCNHMRKVSFGIKKGSTTRSVAGVKCITSLLFPGEKHSAHNFYLRILWCKILFTVCLLIKKSNNTKDGYALNSKHWQDYKKTLPPLSQHLFTITLGMFLGDAGIRKEGRQAHIK